MVFGIYYHRGTAHKLLTFSKPLEHFCRFILYTVGHGTTSWWMKYICAQHRMHHSISDTPDDMNSPKYKPFLAYLHDSFNPNFRIFDSNDVDRYAPDIPYTTDYIQLNLYNRFPYLGVCLIGLFYGLFYNLYFIPVGILLSFIIGRYILVIFSDYVLHKIGYRTESNRGNDCSTNLFPIGFFMSGEELHSNHHNHPGRINQAISWYEFDFGYYWILFFSKLHLLRINRR